MMMLVSVTLHSTKQLLTRVFEDGCWHADWVSKMGAEIGCCNWVLRLGAAIGCCDWVLRLGDGIG